MVGKDKVNNYYFIFIIVFIEWESSYFPNARQVMLVGNDRFL